MAYRQSFSQWHLPRELDGLLLLEDRNDRQSFQPQQDRHTHAEVELHFIERGTGTFSFVDRTVAAEPGMLVWVPPGREHVLEHASADLVRWMLLCRRRVVRRILPPAVSAELLGTSGRELLASVDRAAAASLRQTFRDVLPDRARELPVVNAAMGFLLSRVWQHFQIAAARPEPRKLHPAVATAIRLLRESGEPRTMAELAHAVGLTESHLSKLFSLQVGATITEFRNRIRTERFLELYGDGSGSTVLAAALEAGFGSYPQFYRVFSKHMGYSPAEHRARVRVSRDLGATPRRLVAEGLVR